MITHNDTLAQLCDRIIRIEDGRIVRTRIGKTPVSGKEVPEYEK